ncbi:hypothetical protein Poli38472_004920 [Pythium oligandrum]|uniref:Uncharacterized protein n=1 Tax=Pythium oligandrum TaxID=41045 RepID=A0A8K1FEV4_PYTOL|nr:hypothetical protein Poli38472_004920 [Pythium oligandrum]|eukprot:TMW59851.1 hypothetical protein Poli38472_004920 [Pythium oligandrum]
METWMLDDDPELLRAALAMIEGDGENAKSTDDTATSSPSSEEAWLWLDDLKTDMQSTRRQPSAKRQKEEMVYLRAQIKTMQETLQSLKRQRREQADDVVAIGVWEGVVKRQRDLRAHAELENVKLRVALKTKIKVANALVKMIKKAFCSESESLYPTSKRARFAPNMHSRASKSDFFGCMKTLYQQQALAFPVDRFDAGSLTFHDIQVTDNRADGMNIDVSASWMAPFPIDQVLRVLWESTVTLLQEKLENLVLNTHDSADLLTASYNVRVPTLAKNFAEGFQGAMIMQRFRSTQDAPTVIVSSKCQSHCPLPPLVVRLSTSSLGFEYERERHPVPR